MSDNAPYFVTEDIKRFYKKNGIKHVTPAPYNPSSNGLAERAVRTLKEGLNKFKSGSLNTRVCRFLYNYRKTIHSITGKSPAEMMFGRSFKSTLVSVKSSSNFSKESAVLSKSLFAGDKGVYNVGDAVFAKNFGKGEPWVAGKIVRVLGIRNYEVTVNDFGNMLWKRHNDQLMPRYTSSNRERTKEVPTVPFSLPAVSKPTQVPNASPGEEVLPNDEMTDSSDPNNVEPGDNEKIGGEPQGGQEIGASPLPMVRRSQRVVKPPERLNL